MSRIQTTTNDADVDSVDGGRKPAGFCPYCDYRIDPGLCPECGRMVDTDRLRATPRPLRRRIWLRRIALLAIGVGILIGSRWIYVSRIWQSWVPTSYLIAQQPAADWTFEELNARCHSDALSEAEKIEFCEAVCPIEIKVLSPHPVGEALTVTRVVKGAPIMPPLFDEATCAKFNLYDSELRIDQELILVGALGSVSGDMPFSSDSSSSKTIDKSELSLGTHTINLRGKMIYECYASQKVRRLSGRPVHRDYSLTTSVEIVDRPLSHFLQGEFDENHATDLAGSLRIAASTHSNSHFLIVHLMVEKSVVKAPGLLLISDAISGRLLDGKIKEVRHDVGRIISCIECDLRGLNSVDGLTLNIEYVPALKYLFDMGENDYLAARLSWRNVPVVIQNLHDNQVVPTISEIQSPGFAQLPDSVTEWKPDDANDAGGVCIAN